MIEPQCVLITGASGGLGSALARQYANPGVHIVLAGRDAERLARLGTDCAAAGATHSIAQADVTDSAGMHRLVSKADDEHPIDLIIAAAGISGERGLPGENPALSRSIIEVNVQGVLNTIEPALPRMRARQKGQIGLIASLAGTRGIARGPVYSASKAALIVLARGWRDALKDTGVNVCVVCPGYVRTAMTARHTFSLPLALSPDDAARAIARGLAANKPQITVPAVLKPAGWAFRALPPSLTSVLLPGRGRPVPPDPNSH